MVKIASQPDTLLAWMDCLADPMRLRLLRILERHELGVADLCDVLQTPQSTVSRHLKLLLDQRWVQSRRQGTNRAEPGRNPSVSSIALVSACRRKGRENQCGQGGEDALARRRSRSRS